MNYYENGVFEIFDPIDACTEEGGMLDAKTVLITGSESIFNQ